MEEELSIIEIIHMMVKRWWLILICAVAAGALAFVYTSFFMDPQYKSDGALYVASTRDSVEITQGTITASQKLAETYAEILQRRSFLEEISETMEGRYSVQELKSMVKVSPINETELLEVSVSGENPYDVYQITEAILLQAQEALMDVIKSGSVDIVDNAYLPSSPYSPSIPKNTLIGIIAGMVIAMGIIFIMELVDTRVRSSEEVRARFKQPILGEIPDYGESGGGVGTSSYRFRRKRV